MRDLELWKRIQQPDTLKPPGTASEKGKGVRLLRFTSLGYLLGLDEATIRKLRKEKGILPTYKGVDTCGAEFEAYTPYYYSTYEKEDESKASSQEEDHDPGRGAEPDRPGDRI